MQGLVRILVGAVLMLAYLWLGVAHHWWLGAIVAIFAAGIAAAVQGRAENTRWGAFALALAVLAMQELRRGLTHSFELILALLIWVALSQIMQWLITSNADVTRDTRNTRAPRA